MSSQPQQYLIKYVREFVCKMNIHKVMYLVQKFVFVTSAHIIKLFLLNLREIYSENFSS